MKLLSTTEEGYILQLTPLEMRNIDLAPLCLMCDGNGIVEVNKIEFDSGGIGVVPKNITYGYIPPIIDEMARYKSIDKYNKELLGINR